MDQRAVTGQPVVIEQVMQSLLIPFGGSMVKLHTRYSAYVVRHGRLKLLIGQNDTETTANNNNNNNNTRRLVRRRNMA